MSPRLKPSNDKFFKYMNESSQSMCEGALLLKDFIDNNPDGEEQLKQLRAIGDRSDQVYRKCITKLGKSFITPFEREDIYSLASKLHGILDSIYGIMQMMVLYKTGRALNPNIIGLSCILVQSTQEIQKAVHGLQNLGKNYDLVVESCGRISQYEHEGDYLYRTGVALLLNDTETHSLIDMLKWKEIFERLEKVLDYCEDVGDILKGVAVKYV